MLGLLALAALSACSSANPVTKSDIKQYTGINLCPAVTIEDLTTTEERDTTPGFSFHVAIDMPPACTASFERQLAALSRDECSSMRVRQSGCSMQAAYPAAAEHTSTMIYPLSGNRFDLRFYE